MLTKEQAKQTVLRDLKQRVWQCWQNAENDAAFLRERGLTAEAVQAQHIADSLAALHRDYC